MEFVPILISVLDRPIHFQKCIESLVKSPLAKATHLFIALDAPLAEKHKLGQSKVLSFIENIVGFKEVTLFKREKNMGSSPNQFLAMKDIFKLYDRLIFTEDDNVFSPNFLDFMNQGLELFKGKQDIFSISGHNYLIDIPKSYSSNYYIWPGFDAWGVGLWKEKWNRVDFSSENNRKNALSVTKIIKLNAIAGNYISALFQLAQYGVLHDDFAVCLHLIEKKMYSVFPVVSKVRNNGLDNSGENGGFSGIYNNQVIDEAETMHLGIDEGIQPNTDIYRILKRHFKLKNKQKIKLFFRYIQLKIFQINI